MYYVCGSPPLPPSCRFYLLTIVLLGLWGWVLCVCGFVECAFVCVCVFVCLCMSDVFVCVCLWVWVFVCVFVCICVY